MKIIERYIQQIIELCGLYKVKTLAVFGSILTDKFNEGSDVDFLVDFQPMDHEKEDYVTNYFNLRDALEKLLNRKIDLVEEKGLRNKYLIASINNSKQLIYG